MTPELQTIQNIIDGNPILSAAIGGSVGVSIIYFIKSLPLKLWGWMRWIVVRLFTIEVTITNMEDHGRYMKVLAWLKEQGAGKHQNKFRYDFRQGHSNGPVMKADSSTSVPLSLIHI